MIQENEFLTRGRRYAIYAVFGLFLFGFLSFFIFEDLDASDILVVQAAGTGKLTLHTTPGLKWQLFGTVTLYKKLEKYEFQIPVRFNDGGHGTINGSINYENPLDYEHMVPLHTKYGSQESIQNDIINVVTNKCVYMTGPLMSSKESYAEKRTSLIYYIEDQIKNGVYKTSQKDDKIRDPITGQDKTITIAEIVKDKNGFPERQEEAILSNLGIKTSNFAVTSLPYDQTVEDQIKQQQEINMAVQTSIASAKQAEQRKITVEANGSADAAQAKWEQEVIKAKYVTEAQQKLEVARLEKLAEAENKQKMILKGEGEGGYKRAVWQADGALTQKLDALVKMNKDQWEAIAKYPGNWVPSVVMGNDGKNHNGAQDLINMLSAKTARDLGIDLGVRNNK